MKKLVALTLVLIICSMSMVSCQFSLFTWLHNKLDETPDSFTYTSFTDDELSLMEAHLGEAIPFLPTDEYDLASFYFAFLLKGMAKADLSSRLLL